ncbi:helix-turn-helix domain-containing protein [Saccharopolyspora hattusasensis]|uniref:helix-turn-helix domain-containing protein n=1 Tax=Saccharopolyspora hattusasensis TaxID=1128679 RepID=UPI003D97C4EA
MTEVIQAYKFALDPSPSQENELRSHCGAQRFAYNWGLHRVKAVMDQRKAEASYDLADDELTPSISWSAYSLRKDWNQAKDEVAPWWGENSKESYSSGLANLATALKNWDDSKKGKRKGAKVKFPRFTSKYRTMSCRFTTGSFGLADRAGGTSNCRVSEQCGPTNPPANSPAGSNSAPPRSVQRP